MDYIAPGGIEFLDLNDVEDEERNQILSSLYEWNPSIELPWEDDSYYQEDEAEEYDIPPACTKQQVATHYGPPSNVVVTANINLNEGNSTPQPIFYPQTYQMSTAYPSYVTQEQPLHHPVNTTMYMGSDAQTAHQPVNASVYLGPVYAQPQNSHNMHPPANNYQINETSPNVLTTVVVNSNINYAENSNAYINTKLEITQGFANKPQPDVIPQNTAAANQDLKSNWNENIVDPKRDVVHSVPNVVQSCKVANNVGATPQLIKTVCENGLQSSGIATENSPSSVKSWASLFNNNKSLHNNVPLVKDDNIAEKPLAKVQPFVKSVNNAVLPDVSTLPLKEPFKSNFDDPNLHRLGEFVSNHSIDNRVTSLQPRGLINRSNYCYINSILQAMLACPPVYNLLNGLSRNVAASLEKKKITPVIDCMTRFVKEFHHLPPGMRVSRRPDKNQKKEQQLLVNCDTPFEPFWIQKMLNGLRNDTFVVEGRQEDAEEFLGCLLNGLNDEMLELMKLVGDGSYHGTLQDSDDQNHQQEETEDKEWQVMGPKNKGCITRRTEFNRTPISDVFGGLVRSRIHRSGDQPTDNIQPFFTLQLNIEKATTVREALEVLVCKNQLEGVTSSRTNEEVEAWQQVTLEELPIVLVLHLKCFDYKLDGCTKIIKALEFPVDLKIEPKLLSSKANYSPKERQYKLFAVVYHEGKEASKGHYITDAYHVGYASWLRYDDASVRAVQEENVLKPHGTRVPYLLFYRRSDSVRIKL